MAYRWESPFRWLLETTQDWDKKQLRDALYALAERVDADELQDVFDNEMYNDGYFEMAPSTKNTEVA